MKKSFTNIILLAFTAIAILFGSCTKEPQRDPVPDINEESIPEVIVGVWNVDVNQSTMHELECFDGDTLVEDYTLFESGMISCTLEFAQDGNMVMTTVYDEDGVETPYRDRMKYTIDGRTITWNNDETLTITHIDHIRLILDESAINQYDNGTYSWSMHLDCTKQD